jgi:hypothetical protein
MILGNSALMEAALAAVKTALDGGFLYIFSGSVPESPDDALDMVTDHTQLAMISVDDDGTTGLTFETPSGNVLVKTAAEDWIGTIVFNGAEDGETTLTPTFFRFCEDGDDPTAAATGVRVQGTVGGPSSGADMLRSTTTMTANGTNVIGVSVFSLTQNVLG